MIPKIIHYCWFGRNPKPQQVVEYINQWHKILPDYQFKEWNEDNFDINAMAFTREAYRVKKYAFVSDVCRLYALLTEGGIYLDTDVRLLNSFDPFLSNHSFIGKEVPFKVSTAVIGAEKNCSWVKTFYDSYKLKHFIVRKGLYNDIENTALLTSLLNKLYPNYNKILKVYDVDFFCAKLFNQRGQYCITDNTVAVHEFSGTWINKKFSLLRRVKNILIRIVK